MGLSGMIGKNSRMHRIHLKNRGANMESKVLLYDADGKKIGETFVRRARQLVKQQRAMWTDDSQSAVRFAADTDDWAAGDDKDEGPIPVFDDEAWMVDLAKKRIKWRRLFVAHSIVFSVTFPLTTFALVSYGVAGITNSTAFAIMLMLNVGWLAAFIEHTVRFAVKMSKVRRPDARGGAHDALDKEVAEIKKILDKQR